MLAVAYGILTSWNLKREDGQTMAEYGIILAVVAVVAVAAFTALEGGISGTINNVVSAL